MDDTFPDLGSLSDRELKDVIKQLTDEHLRAKTAEFRKRVAERVDERLTGIENPEQLRAEGREDEARGCWQQAVQVKPELAERYF